MRHDIIRGGPDLDQLRAPSQEAPTSPSLDERARAAIETLATHHLSEEVVTMLEAAAQKAVAGATVSDNVASRDLEYRRIAALRELKQTAADLLNQSNHIALEAQDYFGNVTIAITGNENGKVTNVPTFPAVKDPIQALFSASPFHEQEHMLPCLNRLTVNVLMTSWRGKGTATESELNDDAVHFNDVAFGNNGEARYQNIGHSVAQLDISRSTPLPTWMHTILADVYEGSFFSGTLNNKGFEWPVWNETLRIFKEEANSRGLFVAIEENKIQGTAYSSALCAGPYPKHNPLVVLESFQEALRKAHQQPRQHLLFQKETPTVVPSDVGMDSYVELYASQRPEIQEVFDALKETADKWTSLGLSYQLAHWLVDAATQLESAIQKNNPMKLTIDDPGLSFGTIGEAPEYVKEFCAAVNHLSTSQRSVSRETWLSSATATLAALEQGLAAYANLPAQSPLSNSISARP